LGECVYLPGAQISAADVRDADALIVRTRTRCDRALLEGSRVRFIATATIGYDHIDVDYLRAAGIAWTNCPGCNAGSVGQYVAASLIRLELAGKLRLQGATVGVVGVGHVGSRVVEAVSALGCRVLRNDPPRAEKEDGFVSLEQILQEADVISIHTPLTYDGPYPTFHLFGADTFAAIPPHRHPVLLNAGRGEVVDTEALKTAVSSGNLGPVVIDTWENEPRIDRALLDMAFIATPHIAGYSADGKANGTRMALEAVARFFGVPIKFDIKAPKFPDESAYFEPLADERLRLYDPFRDSLALKADPAAFERLRGDYPLRRERHL